MSSRLSPSSQSSTSLQPELPRILAEADRAPLPAAPPPCGNTGVENSNAGVDWVELTHSDRTGGIWSSLLGVEDSEWVELARGMHGYPCARQLDHVTVWYGAREDMGSHLCVSGQGCRELEARGVVASWPAFLERCIHEFGCRVTRLDLFRDDRDGVLDVGECERKAEAGEVSTRTKEGGVYKRFTIGGESRGMTVTIGKRVSDTMVRIYDKARQLCPADRDMGDWLREHGSHVRVEVELRRERAQGAAVVLIARGFGGGVVAGLINAHVEFKEGYARGRNGGRVAMWEAWRRVLGAPEKVVLAVKVEGRGLLGALKSIENQWGPIIAVLVSLYKGNANFILQMAARNYDRVREKHIRMLEEAVQHREGCVTCCSM